MRGLRGLGIAVAALLLVAAAGLGAFYLIDGQPMPATAEYLNSPGYSAAQSADGSWLFKPEAPNGRGVMIMHGALIYPQAYARSAAFFAERGYTVYLPFGGSLSRLSINAIDAARTWLADSGIETWATIGHSMGGMASLEVVSSTPEVTFAGAALWATSMPKDFSALELPMLYLWGDDDGLLPKERFEASRSFLPATTRYTTVRGANHRKFAMYTHQFFDNEGSLDWQSQIDIANELTLEFFEQAF